MKMEAKAQLRNLRVAPRKIRLLVDLVRGMKAEDALLQLQFSRKHAARPLLKLIESAIANAVNNLSIKKDSLLIKTAFVDKGKTLRRWMPRAMGRATPIRKRTSHITIVLEGEADEVKKETKKKEVKTEVKKDIVKKEKTEVKKIVASKDAQESKKEIKK